MSDRKLRRVKARWQEFALVCRKCSKRLNGGFGDAGDQRLAKALRQHLRQAGEPAKGRKARLGVVEVGCLDICPKHGVVVIRSGAPGDWLIIPAGMPLVEVAALLAQGEAQREAAAG